MAPSRARQPWEVRKAPIASAVALVSLACLGVLASSESVTIATASNITMCLSIQDDRLVLVDCLSDVGQEWNWTARLEPGQGHRLRPVSTYAEYQGLSPGKCMDTDLKFWPCSDIWALWTWDKDTLQISVMTDTGRTCLTLVVRKLQLAHCKLLRGTVGGDQNGYGAPAEQTWVIFPTNRPQIRILDRLKFPLRAAGRHIMDSQGLRVKLAGVNWFGAQREMLVNNGLGVVPVRRVARTIKYMGFNSVRLCYADAMVTLGSNGRRPSVPDAALLQANPELRGLSALEVFDETVKALTKEGLLVVISRYTRTTSRCCNGSDGNEMWSGDNYTIHDWLSSLTFMAARYSSHPRVIGFDIFNEPRLRDADVTLPWWGGEASWTQGLFGVRYADWRSAAAQGAVAVWKGNPNALVIIQGDEYASHLPPVQIMPLPLAEPCLKSRIAYSAHEHQSFWPLYKLYSDATERWEEWPGGGLAKTLRDSTEKAVRSKELSESGDGVASSALDRDFMVEGGKVPVPYEQWRDVRRRTVFFLPEQDVAPVWIGEFGTAQKANNAHWQHVLQYYRAQDVSWAYWALDPFQVPPGFMGTSDAPGEKETFGLFDPSRADYSGVVGWKLQDLIGIQAPSPHFPEQLPRLEDCSFDLRANQAAAEASLSDLGAELGRLPAPVQGYLQFVLGVTVLAACCLALCVGGALWARWSLAGPYMYLDGEKLEPLKVVTVAGGRKPAAVTAEPNAAGDAEAPGEKDNEKVFPTEARALAIEQPPKVRSPYMYMDGVLLNAGPTLVTKPSRIKR